MTSAVDLQYPALLLLAGFLIRFISHRVIDGYSNDKNNKRTIKTRRQKVSQHQPGKQLRGALSLTEASLKDQSFVAFTGLTVTEQA